jgi:hypothetical protein
LELGVRELISLPAGLTGQPCILRPKTKDVIMILPTTKGNIMLAYAVSILALLSPAIMTIMTTTKK